MLPALRKTPVIFITNHLSYLDASIVGAAITRYFGRTPWFMAKKRLWEEFQYRISFGLLGALPYKRRGEDVQEHLDCLKSFVSILRAGEPLIVFPEGTIPGEIELAKTGLSKLRSDVEAHTGLLKSGALVPFLALVAGAQVLPVGLSGAGKVLPPEAHPGKIWAPRKKGDHIVKIRFGEPLDVCTHLKEALQNGLQEETLNRYTKEVMMPALSSLVDFNLHEVPVKIPLTPEDYVRIQDFERKIAEEYRTQGKFAHAESITNRLESISKRMADEAAG